MSDLIHRSAPALLAANFVLLAAIALGGPTTPEAAADGAAGERGLIALTATARTGDDVLFVIDPDRRHMVAYKMVPKGLQLVAARKLDYDFKVFSYRDASDKQFTYEELKRRFTQPKSE